MKWRTSFDWNPKDEEAFGYAFLLSVAWFLTTLAFHLLMLWLFGLSIAPNYHTGDDDIVVVYLLPVLTLMPFVVVGSFYGIESWWRKRHQMPARLAYGALGLALLVWCWWSLQINLSYGHRNRFHGYGVPTDTIQAAAYASIGFPLALACACLLLAILRRPPASDDAGEAALPLHRG